MDTQTKARAPAFIFILITAALDMLALGIIIPVLPKLIERFVDGDTASAATYVGLFGTVFALMQFIVSPILGALSDRYGRRKIVLLSNLGLGLDYILMALAPNLAWLFVGRVLAGITSASVSAAGAYISDITPPEKRAQNFGLLGAALGMGFVIGPAFGGIIGEIDLRYPFWAAAIMSLLNFCYGYFVLPESLTPENRAPFLWARANPLGSLKLLLSTRQLWSFGSAIFLSQLAHTVLPTVYVLYASYRYGWSPFELGLLLTAVGVSSMIAQGGLIKPIVKRTGESNAAIIGLFCGAIGMAIYATAWTGNLVWLGVPVAAFWGLFNAAAQSIMSQNVQSTEQGKLQGANTSIMALANMVGPPVFAAIFAWSISPSRSTPVPGLSLYVAGGVLFIAAVITYFVTRKREA